jgi:hypothetical protein
LDAISSLFHLAFRSYLEHNSKSAFFFVFRVTKEDISHFMS